MTPERRTELRRKYAPLVRTLCDEMHGHSWARGCFVSDNPEALVICELIDEVEAGEAAFTVIYKQAVAAGAKL